ncbi:hypothetical protein [Streptomyces xylophagus]|uniref:hypothetical protein n=1 Tax=Streptomyces xylophagus TaxID=285514 RepID=UPI0005B9B3BD|nr:hypothetical protein [Streptomyces xylophagus]
MSPPTFFMDRSADALRAGLAAFAKVVHGDRSSRCTLTNAVESNRVAKAATTSLRDHHPVHIEEVRR